MTEQIRVGKRASPQIFVVYGVGGVGKTTLAAASGAVVMPVENGVNHIDCKSIDPRRDFAHVMSGVEWAYSSMQGESGFAIDGLDRLQAMIEREVCAKCKCNALAEIPYGKGEGLTLPYWRELLDGLEALRDRRGLNVWLIGHSKIEPFRNPSTDTYDRYTIALGKESGPMVQYWADNVFYCGYKVYTTSTDKGFNRKEVKGVGGTERILYTTERPSHVAKNRIDGLPDELPLSWPELSKYLNPASLATAA
jgi:hypothetical protein